MTQVRVGVQLPNVASVPQTSHRYAAMVESWCRQNCESVWLGDHLLFRTPVVDPLVLMGALVGSECALGTNVALLSLRSGAWLAKSISSIAWMHGAPVEVGLGVGGEFAPEFETAGVPLSTRGKVFDREAESLLRTLRLVEPRNPDRALPRLWIGGRSTATLRRIKELDAGWTGMLSTPAEVEGFLRHAAEQDLAPPWMTVIPCVLLISGERHAEKLERALREAEALYGKKGSSALTRRWVVGSPQTIREAIQDYSLLNPYRLILQVFGAVDVEEDVSTILSHLDITTGVSV